MSNRRPGSQRAFFERTKLGRCSCCGKKGVGPEKSSSPPIVRLVRSCRYCLVEHAVILNQASPKGEEVMTQRSEWMFKGYKITRLPDGGGFQIEAGRPGEVTINVPSQRDAMSTIDRLVLQDRAAMA